MPEQDFFASLKEQLTSTVEKCLKPKENAEELNEAENIMFNHNVLQACWDLLILSHFYDGIKNQENTSESFYCTESIKAYYEQLLKASGDENIAFPNICEGTQLLNSFETMLILPYQLVHNKIKNNKNSFHLYDYSEEQWQDKFPVLKKYIFCETDYKYSSRYFYLNDKIGKVEQENPYNPIYVIRHLRNSFSHDRIGIEPINQGKEIESLRFTDKEDKDLYEIQIAQEYMDDFLKYFPKYNGKGYKNSFSLTIKYEDLEEILNEIYNFLSDVLKG